MKKTNKPRLIDWIFWAWMLLGWWWLWVFVMVLGGFMAGSAGVLYSMFIQATFVGMLLLTMPREFAVKKIQQIKKYLSNWWDYRP